MRFAKGFYMQREGGIIPPFFYALTAKKEADKRRLSR